MDVAIFYITLVTAAMVTSKEYGLVTPVARSYRQYWRRFCKLLCKRDISRLTPMSRLVLPGMLEREKGLIINISSECASLPHPMQAIYSASKIFVTYFSRCLNAEYRSKGITVQCVVPLMVSTNMTFNIPVSPLVKSAASFARDALNTVGYTTYTCGCLTHALQHYVLSIIFPGWLRLSSIFVQHMAKYARFIEPHLRARMAEIKNKQD